MAKVKLESHLQMEMSLPGDCIKFIEARERLNDMIHLKHALNVELRDQQIHMKNLIFEIYGNQPLYK